MRPWLYSIADGTAKSKRDSNATVTRFSCFFHFQKEVRSKNLSASSQWLPVHNSMAQLLTNTREERIPLIVQQCVQLIEKIEDPNLRQKHSNLLSSIESDRLLPKLRGFTHGWNSQSASEVINANVTSLRVHARVSFSVVLDKMLSCGTPKEYKRGPNLYEA